MARSFVAPLSASVSHGDALARREIYEHSCLMKTSAAVLADDSADDLGLVDILGVRECADDKRILERDLHPVVNGVAHLLPLHRVEDGAVVEVVRQALDRLHPGIAGPVGSGPLLQGEIRDAGLGGDLCERLPGSPDLAHHEIQHWLVHVANLVIFDLISKPPMAKPSGYAAGMRGKDRKSAEEVLATNLAKLVDREGGQSAFARHVGVPQKTVSRILSRENSARLDFLDKLYDKTKLEPWQLLFPLFDPLSPPHADGIGGNAERPVLTPDERDLLERYRAADQHIKEVVDTALSGGGKAKRKSANSKSESRDAPARTRKAS